MHPLVRVVFDLVDGNDSTSDSCFIVFCNSYQRITIIIIKMKLKPKQHYSKYNDAAEMRAWKRSLCGVRCGCLNYNKILFNGARDASARRNSNLFPQIKVICGSSVARTYSPCLWFLFEGFPMPHLYSDPSAKHWESQIGMESVAGIWFLFYPSDVVSNVYLVKRRRRPKYEHRSSVAFSVT